jgi:hypothetical protein
MANYTNEYSKLPYQIYKPHNYKDVDDTVAKYVNEIKRLQSQGLYDQANRLVENNKDVLGSYVFSVEAFNAIEEETRNLEIMCMEKKQSIYYNDEPSDPILNDVWIS